MQLKIGVSEGPSKIKVQYAPQDKPALGNAIILFINDQKVAEGSSGINAFRREVYTAAEEGIEIGRDSNVPLDDRYTTPFKLTATLNKIVIASEK